MHAHAMTGHWGPGHPLSQWLTMTGRGHRGRPHRRPHGGPGGFGPGFGPGFGRGPRARRGDVRAALLVLLAEEPRNGYGLMQEIEARSNGAWRPSPGSVYPALSQLEDEGLVRATESGGRKLFELTDAGRTYVTENADELGTPWEQVGHGHGRELRHEVRALADAVEQVARTGTPEQVAAVTTLLEKARREVYLTLAGAAPTSDS